MQYFTHNLLLILLKYLYTYILTVKATADCKNPKDYHTL